ncbi:MAG: hemolysin family protein [Gammaproteobacteria bacterium]|nr:hemolysin family protein [Gammaproteobacteria bacterium]
MLLLVIYVLIALGFSFLCSIAEAVILSVTTPHIMLLKQQGKASGALLEELKRDINSPLAAILTLNTIAHTVGAAGAGAQAAKVFGSASLGITSAVLTLLILVFSEIIPKTLGAHYWKQLAPATAWTLRGLIWLLRPFVWLSAKLTSGLTHGPGLKGFNREEIAIMADLSHAEGQLGPQERRIIKNLLRLREGRVTDAMTPRTVIFSVPEDATVGTFLDRYGDRPFSRIPLHRGERGEIEGFVLRSDLLLAQARGETERPLSDFRRELPAVPETSTLTHAYNELVRRRAHLMLIVDEYGTVEGLLTLEDVIETLLGLEIVDESDATVDMQELARSLWQKRAREMGLETGTGA